GVTEIGERAFDHSSSLEKVIIPLSVASIGKEAFRGCRALTVVTHNKAAADYARQNGVRVISG
ncbi:MAG: leucine-rich repeat protein, partial [Abditibacteriota bacterium]|nr:leucine-rich repeat protein [Abditibacteriota bacterium]